MAHLEKANGTVVTLATIADVEDDSTKYVVFNQDVYEKFSYKGDSKHERGRTKKWATGDVIKETELQAYFHTATITSFTPSTGLATAGGTVITAVGTYLSGTTGVTVGGAAATAVTVVNDETLKFTTPAKTAGTYAVVAATPGGTLTKAAALTFA